MPSFNQPTPTTLRTPSAHNLKTPRRLLEIPSNHSQNAFTHIVKIKETTNSYRNNTEKGLQALLQHEQIGDVVRQYPIMSYKEMMTKICKEESRKKARTPIICKGSLMKNRRDNRNTHKAKMFMFSQRSFQQNRRVTINRILDGTLSLENEEDVYLDIKEVEEVYVNRLERAKATDTSEQTDIPPKHNDSYRRITNREVKEALKGIKRDTASGPDKCRLKDIKDLSTEEVSAIFNKWWSSGIPEEAVECRTTLLPKSINEREQVGNWKPITIGNLLMRMHGKIWDKRLRQDITTSERQKGFVPVDGCFQNVSILKSIINSQRKKKKPYQIVFLDLTKAFGTVTQDSIRKAL